MIRLLLFLAALALAAYGLTWLAENPGEVTLAWRGVEYNTSLMVALGVVAGLAIVLALAWGVVRFVFRIPSLVSLAAKARRREKGYAALSRGMVAVGSGDARAASRHAAEARKHLGDEPLAKLLRAQAAQLAGDRAGAVAAFREMLDHPQTHALGLRGLHIEARRSGDSEAALDFAMRAHKHAALPWAGQAVLDDRAAHGDWAGALGIVESNAAARLIDKPTANRWRAVLKTAMAQDLAERDAKAALALAQEACALAPGLVPAAILCGRLTAANGDTHRASKIIEAAYRQTPHPGLASAYVRLRRGNSAADRLARARALARLAPFDSESQITVGRAALEARDLRRGARGGRAAAGAGRSGRPPDRARLSADGRHRGGGGRRRGGARMARPRRARAARSRLGRRRGHQRSLGAGFALGRARRLRLAHARRAPERAGAVRRAAAGRRRPRSRRFDARGLRPRPRSPPRPSRSRRAAPERSSCCRPARRTIPARTTRASPSPDFGCSRANDRRAGTRRPASRRRPRVFLAAPAAQPCQCRAIWLRDCRPSAQGRYASPPRAPQ